MPGMESLKKILDPIFGIDLFVNVGLLSLISIAVLLTFIPIKVWGGLTSRLKNKFGGVQIYYDGDCGFCRRSAWLIYVCLALPKSSVGSAQKNPTIFADMQKNDSWVVVGRDQSRHFGFKAMVVLLAASPLFFFLAPLGKISFVSTLGEKCYRFVAIHRPRTCAVEEE